MRRKAARLTGMCLFTAATLTLALSGVLGFDHGFLAAVGHPLPAAPAQAARIAVAPLALGGLFLVAWSAKRGT